MIFCFILIIENIYNFLKTFLDDPLRILRTLRFATRFGYKISNDIVESLKDERICVNIYVFFKGKNIKIVKFI